MHNILFEKIFPIFQLWHRNLSRIRLISYFKSNLRMQFLLLHFNELNFNMEWCFSNYVYVIKLQLQSRIYAAINAMVDALQFQPIDKSLKIENNVTAQALCNSQKWMVGGAGIHIGEHLFSIILFCFQFNWYKSQWHLGTWMSQLVIIAVSLQCLKSGTRGTHS